MPNDYVERMQREIVEGLHRALINKGEYKEVSFDDFEVMYQQACELLRKQMLGKFKNLQEGEALQITFRVDILNDGKIRGGSGAERNMPQYIEWRDKVYQRDNYTCVDCGARGKLNAHHIKSWAKHPDLRFEVSNGKTVCKDCHAKYHPHIGFLNSKKP